MLWTFVGFQISEGESIRSGRSSGSASRKCFRLGSSAKWDTRMNDLKRVSEPSDTENLWISDSRPTHRIDRTTKQRGEACSVGRSTSCTYVTSIYSCALVAAKAQPRDQFTGHPHEHVPRFTLQSCTNCRAGFATI